MSASYFIPAAPVTVEQTVKKSNFICYLSHTPSRQDAMSHILKVQEKHRDANHNCWAFIAGAPNDHGCWGMNDDGEPKGCAGKPMFNVIINSDLGEICVVVTRYFGGIKLGTGGMARAYSSTVGLALNQLERVEKIFYEAYTFVTDYSLLQRVEHLLGEVDAQVVNQQFTDKVTFQVNLTPESIEQVKNQLRDMSGGKILL